MRAVDIILKKREGHALSAQEIEELISGYVRGEVPDYQLAAWCMAVYFQGMSAEETANLTMAMVNSGERVDLSPIPGIKVDKHSTGGVADTTTLILAPLVAAAGVPVAKMSGRGLGHTGGTIDKLESIPGFRTALARSEFLDQVGKIGVAVAGQSGNLVPADKKLYALRDVTATVDSIPLIASSIMSKKIAAGAQAIVLDVKTGSGAFMKREEDARRLAEIMVSIGRQVGRETVALLSNMDEPLGSAIGNALEVEEAIQVLRGETKGPLLELALTLGAHMVKLSGRAGEVDQAKESLHKLVHSGAALTKLANMIQFQGGNPAVVENTGLLPQAKYRDELVSWEDGYLFFKDTQAVGLAAMLLGAGRARKEDEIDLAAGLKMHARAGTWLKKGDRLCTLYYNDRAKLPQALSVLKNTLVLQNELPVLRPLVSGVILSGHFAGKF